MNGIDDIIRRAAGPDPVFDPVARAFLENSAEELRSRLKPGGILDAASLGREVPWLWRLRFRTRGRCRDEGGNVASCDDHVVMLKYAPDCLRRADRWEMLTLVRPLSPFHPNLRERHVCLSVYPGQPLVELCESLHALFAWKLRQLSETDALDADACAWGRANLEALVTDDRPLFGRSLTLDWEKVEAAG